MSESAAPAKIKHEPFRFRLVGDINVANLVVAVISVTIAWLGFLRKIDNAKKDVSGQIQSAQHEVTGQIQNVQQEVLAQKFIITFPADGSRVHLTDIVRGRTPFTDTNTYLIITPETGDDWVQDGPIKIDNGGFWTAQARFGTGEIGVGQKFMIRALSTKSVLAMGPLKPANFPADAVLSDAVTVVRR